ncbi:MAG: winged helix-turn-helix transcriptional regulator [Candidatus Caldarchaeum sp.]
MSSANASIQARQDVLRCKHALPILSSIYQRPQRFSEICHRLGIHDKVLVRKLEVLMSHGLVMPTSGGYALTESGRRFMDSLQPVMNKVEPEVLAEVLKCKWSKEILKKLVEGPRYSVEVVDGIAGLSWKVASERLKKLQRLGLVSRTVVSEQSPVRVLYSLTRKGMVVAWWVEVLTPAMGEGLP